MDYLRSIRFGGTDGTHWFSDVWSYDPRTNAWSQLDCIGFIPVPREGHSAALVDDVMYIFGGRSEEGADLGDLAAFRITSRRWYTFQNMGTSPSPRSGHSMTAYGKQIVVLAGEPSSAPMDPGELSLVYVLDTSKIRYPVDQQIQQTPVGERVPGNRRPSTEKSALPQSKGMLAREPSAGPPDGPKRMFSGSRESIAGGPGTILRVQENGPVNLLTSTNPGSRLPRAAGAQAPPGPPPQQAPPRRMNGIPPTTIGPRSQTPTKDTRNYGPPLDTSRAASFDRQEPQSKMQEASRGLSNQTMSPSNRRMSPTTNGIINTTGHGRGTPTPQTVRPSNAQHDEESNINDMQTSPPHRDQQRPSIEEMVAAQHSTPVQKRSAPTQHDTFEDRSMSRNGAVRGHDLLLEQLESMGQELEVIKSRNVWYASELALARKAGYRQRGSPSPTFDERAEQSFRDDEKPLVEALIAMKTELADVQNSVESRVLEASQKVVDAEQQRDKAIQEAIYAKAKLAAYSGSQLGTPQLEDTSRDFAEADRSMDMSRKLGVVLAEQATHRSKIEELMAELASEKRVRELAESSADAAHRRATELDQAHNPGEIDGLRAELYEVQKIARDEAASKAEALARAKVLEVDIEDLKGQLEEAVKNSDAQFATLGSLREAVAATNDKGSLLMRQLDEERTHREELQRKLLQLRSEHEERTGELETTTKKLHDAEQLADKHANEAQTHRMAVMSGLENLSSRNPNGQRNALHDKRIAILQEQLDSSNELTRKNQLDADNAAEKLRRAEERIAGLETYQEQASRENLGVRKQLQEAVRGAQILQAQHNDVQKQLESHQRDTSALAVQHNALKELLDERPSSASGQGRSRNLDIPGGRLGNPDRDQTRDLELQLAESKRLLEDTKAMYDARAEEAERSYKEKVDQLEQDYQSAVYYVKGTEKMLKRMKDELTKSKEKGSRLESEIEEGRRINAELRSMDGEPPADWENERQQLRREIEEMQESLKGSISHLDRQMQEVKSELRNAQQERDHYRANNEEAQNQLTMATRKAREDIEQLRSENAQLESRAMDAEHKVSMLLDQVDSSVDKYRRQSQQMSSEGYNHTRNTSTNSFNLGGHSHNTSIGADSAFSATAPDNRNSIALDSLATELETLRTQWEGTHRTYRLSSQFDFERTPTTATGGELSDSLASWRKRLDAEERSKESSRSPPLQSLTSPSGGMTNGRVASPRGGEMERERLRGGMTSQLRRHEGEPTPMNVI